MCKNKKEPLRRCVGCNEMKEKHSLLRIVAIRQKESEEKQQTFVVDHTHKLNGRGAYICKNETCIQKAIKLRGFDRSYKRSVPSKLYEQVEKGE